MKLLNKFNFSLFNISLRHKKYSFVGLDAPSAANSGNWLYYEQSYDDVLLFETKHDGLAFVIEA